MFYFAPLVVAADPTAFCVYPTTNKTTCGDVVKRIDPSLTSLKEIKEADLSGYTLPTETDLAKSALIFIGDMTITIANLDKFQKDATHRLAVYAFNCNVIVTVTKDYPMTLVLPLCLKYTQGPLKPTVATTISIHHLKEYGLKWTLDKVLTISEISNAVDCAPPKDLFTFEAGGELIYQLISETLQTPFLTINTGNVVWGKTTLPITANSKKIDAPIVFLLPGSPPDQTILPTLLKACYFAPSFKDLTDEKKYATLTVESYVPEDPTTPPKYVDGSVTITQYESYCLVADTETSGCPSYSESFKFQTFTKISDTVTLGTNSVVAFSGTLAIPSEKLTYLPKALLLDDAKEITVTYKADSDEIIVDGRQDFWKFVKTETPPASLLAAGDLKFTDNVMNVKIPGQSSGVNTFPGVTTLAITDISAPMTFKPSATYSTPLKILPLFTGPAQVKIMDKKIVVNGITIDLEGSSGHTGLDITAYPGESMTVSQDGASTSLPVSLTATNGGGISFDSTWDTVKDPFVTTQGQVTVESGSGIPPWLAGSSLAQGTNIQEKPSSTPTPPSDGLPDWGIALIVIACVVVVAIIVVVVLNMTGVIHLCGKKKVEV